MKYLAVVCGLLLAGSVLAENVYFEGYVTVKMGNEEEETKANYAIRGDVVELTLSPPEGEDGEPFVISFMMKKTDDRKVIALYSADGEQRIGTGTETGEDAGILEFALIREGIKAGDVTMEQQSNDDGDMPGLTLKVKIVGMMEIAFEGLLAFDLNKYMRCSNSDDPDC